jgi:transposase
LGDRPLWQCGFRLIERKFVRLPSSRPTPGAFAQTPPLPATPVARRSRSPSGRSHRHRLSRLGNRKLNAALHVVVLTQARVHPRARAYIAKKRAEGKTTKERSAA